MTKKMFFMAVVNFDECLTAATLHGLTTTKDINPGQEFQSQPTFPNLCPILKP